MRHRKAILSIVVPIIGLSLTELHAQKAIPVTGGNTLGNGDSVSYTVGQIVYTTDTKITGSIAL